VLGLGSVYDAQEVGGGIVNLYQLSFDLADDLDALQASSFTLATVSLYALAAGASGLAVSINSLGDSLGNPLEATVSGASVTIDAGPAVVPIPALTITHIFSTL